MDGWIEKTLPYTNGKLLEASELIFLEHFNKEKEFESSLTIPNPPYQRTIAPKLTEANGANAHT